MGKKINKEIGYFIEDNLIDMIIDREKFNALNLEEMTSDHLIKFIDFAIEFYENKNSIEMDLFAFAYNENHLISNNIQISDLIKSLIFDRNEFKGIFFKTPNLYLSSRYNNLIDFYENNENEKDSIFKILEPLYPEDYYVFIEKFKLGDLEFNIGDKISPKNHLFNLVKNKTTIGVPYDIYLLAEFLGILKEKISYSEFCFYFSPVIATYWI